MLAGLIIAELKLIFCTLFLHLFLIVSFFGSLQDLESDTCPTTFPGSDFRHWWCLSSLLSSWLPPASTFDSHFFHMDSWHGFKGLVSDIQSGIFPLWESFHWFIIFCFDVYLSCETLSSLGQALRPKSKKKKKNLNHLVIPNVERSQYKGKEEEGKKRVKCDIIPVYTFFLRKGK